MRHDLSFFDYSYVDSPCGDIRERERERERDALLFSNSTARSML